MSALSFARQAFGLEKPHSSVTDWVDILTSTNIAEEAFEGIPELVDAIRLQASGPAEAARALRKKLKHGQVHQQYRALVLVKALVENAGPKFHTAFSDGQLIDVFKQLNSDPSTDKRVKKKLLAVLMAWRDQYQPDPAMSLFAGLYQQCAGARYAPQDDLEQITGLSSTKIHKKRDKEETKKREKHEREERRKNEEEQRRRRAARVPFNLEKDKPKVIGTIAEASQASSNLVNAIMLVNPENDSLLKNERVQECLSRAKQTKKSLVRYIQLVEDEDLIGTLIETNDRIIAALEMYDKLLNPGAENANDDMAAVTRGLAAAQISMAEDDVSRFQEEQHAAIERERQNTDIYSDLQDLNFGALGTSSNNLPAPLRPSTVSDGYHGKPAARRSSLSDFSDYISSDEGMHNARRGSPRRAYVDVSDDPEDVTNAPKEARVPLVTASDDPFADPFADETPTRH
ncbi:hypothetical protein AX17_000673 [Amanita inopinata Kibby_2008]|nr:hypothetical protein AX17_000673 [Amanita inopinata Kibby_2008]